MTDDLVRRHEGAQRWERVGVHADKAEGEAPFRDVTRQVLVDDDRLGAQLRHFEVDPGGWTTLERHEHVHDVVVLRGHGRCLLDTAVHEIGPNDLVDVPPMTWHQFRAADDEPLGSLCLVRQDRDRPQPPTAGVAASLPALLATACSSSPTRPLLPGGPPGDTMDRWPWRPIAR